MPRLKKADPPFADVERLLRGYRMDGPKLGVILGVTKTTALKRINHPELLSLADLRLSCRVGGIPADRIREALKFDV